MDPEDTPTRSRIRYTDSHKHDPGPPPKVVIDMCEGKDLTKRQVPEIKPPATSPPTDAQFYATPPPPTVIADQPAPIASSTTAGAATTAATTTINGSAAAVTTTITRPKRPDANFLRDHFFQEGRLTESQALFILAEATALLRREENLVRVRSPVTICGDIHGQYYDLMKLFEVGGNLDNGNSYLFLGDYVDRGSFGIECLLYLYTLKLWHPTKFILLRGNHECRHLTEYFTFKRECLHKYSPAVYEACILSFHALPLAALVDDRFFCVHGGLSPDMLYLSDLERVNRFQEPGSTGILCDLLWSDPIVNFGHEDENPRLQKGATYITNDTRGCSWFYTYEAVCQFLERNGLLGVIRGHEAQDAGYTMHRKTPTKKFPSVITIFSAPNYLDVYHNRGAVLKYADKNITIRQYNASPHPYWLPNFMDAFTWSLPFMGAKIAEMLLAILSICSEEELDTDSSSGDEDEATAGQAPEKELHERRQDIKNKILAVGRMQRVFALLREEAENASELDGAANTAGAAIIAKPFRPDELSAHELSVQGNQIRRSIHSFSDARASDLANERIPQFDRSPSPTVFPVPSMRVPSRKSSFTAGDSSSVASSHTGTPIHAEPDIDVNIDMLVRGGEEVDDAVTQIAERFRRRPSTGRPKTKRFETT